MTSYQAYTLSAKTLLEEMTNITMRAMLMQMQSGMGLRGSP